MNLSADSLISPYTLHRTIYKDGVKTLQVRVVIVQKGQSLSGTVSM